MPARTGKPASERERSLLDDLRWYVESHSHSVAEQAAAVGTLLDFLHTLSPQKSEPVDRVRWVPLTMVSPNDYNPNSVAAVEMKLLYISILHDHYTQPVVTVWDEKKKLFVIVDGFHRYFVMKTYPDIYERCHGLLPIVVIDKGENDRMASTVRHNRARGKHSVQGMSSMVLTMLENGWEDAAICNELGMTPQELLRLKHITGFSKLFADTSYKQAWMLAKQVRVAAEYKKTTSEPPAPPAVIAAEPASALPARTKRGPKTDSKRRRSRS